MPSSYWNHNAAYYPWVARATRGCRRVLDVGCGTGELALMLARDGRRVTGIDPSEQCTARARSQAPSGDVRFVVASLDDFQTDDAFDAVTFVASLHHMDMDAAIAKAKALLASGGVIAIVGLASASSPLDHAIDALRVIPSWVSSRLHRMRTSEELGIPTSYAVPTMAQVRDAASRQLPGATMRPGLHWRYLLSWKKDQTSAAHEIDTPTPERTPMTLLKGIGMRFSELRDNHEPAPYWVWHRQDVRTYTRFGVLPTGESFGVARTPTQENSYARDTAIITEDGEIRACGWAFPDGGIGNHYPEPEVMIASPSAKTIVWLGGGELWVWYQDDGLQRFISGFTKRVSIPDDAAVLDARMNENGTLDLWCEGGARHVYSCDGDVLVRDHHAADLLRSADGETIIPVTHAAEEHPEGVLGYMESCFSAFPQAAGFLIEGDVDLGNWDLCGLHARELRFAPEVKCIEAGAFSMLIGLERVVIPATVRMVEDCAFQYCDTLTDLIIEGDLSRVASWREGAFSECPCEEYYLDLRRKAAAGEL